MDIRTFRAATLQEALEQVRETLGPDAAVLHTREVKRSRLGLFSSSLVEVDASIEMPVAGRFARRHSPNATEAAAGNSVSESRTKRSQPLAPATATPTPDTNKPTETASTPSDALPSETELRHDSIKATLPNTNDADTSNNNAQRLPAAVLESLTAMLEAGIEANLAKSLLQSATENLTSEQMNEAMLIQGRVCQLVSKSLRVADPLAIKSGEQTVIALIGSTGVGKTTTLAKLAASLQEDQPCNVGIITLDTLRPGAVDQLLQYAETLDAALEVVSTPNQFLPALQRLKSCDVVLIDTAGRSPNDHEQIQVLQELLVAAKPTSVQLVVSATSSISHLKVAIQQFAPLQPNGIVITKLDEAIAFGEWLSVLQQCEVPISYVAHGQHVPEDIAPANRRRLASMLLGLNTQSNSNLLST